MEIVSIYLKEIVQFKEDIKRLLKKLLLYALLNSLLRMFFDSVGGQPFCKKRYYIYVKRVSSHRNQKASLKIEFDT
jgi:hypothetical protein